MITELHVTNLMRVREVSIHPDGAGLVEITGCNGMGKSAILRAAQILLGGGKFIPADPVRHGEDSAEMSCVLSVPCDDCKSTGDGDKHPTEGTLPCETCDGKGHVPKYHIAREIKNGKSELVLTSPDGKFRYKESPQSLLHEYFTDVGFDAVAFAMMTRTKRDEFFMKLVGLDFTDVDARLAAVFVERADNNRDARAAEAQLEELPEVEAPDAEVKLVDLLAERDEAERLKRENERRAEAITHEHRLVAEAEDAISELNNQLEAARAKQNGTIKSLKELLNEVPAEVPDIAAITTRINSAEETNVRVRQRQARNKKLAEVEALRQHGLDLHHRVEALRSDRRLMIETAEMPLEAFSYDVDNGVMYNGVVYDQASQSDQLIGSTALGFKINPGKVGFIKDGALLDSERRAELAQFVKEQGGQVFIEIVTDGEDVGFVIEDGVLAVPEEAQAAVA